MERRVGYPEEFRFLDDQHDEIGRTLDKLRQPLKGIDHVGPRKLALDVFRQLKEHIASEEAVMAKLDYPEKELHMKYHESLLYSVELILELFDTERMQEQRENIANFLENKLQEEILTDRLLAEFLEARRQGN